MTTISDKKQAVKELKDSQMLKGEMVDSLKKVYDIERLIGKISYGNSNGREMNALKNSLMQIPNINLVFNTNASTIPLKNPLYKYHYLF